MPWRSDIATALDLAADKAARLDLAAGVVTYDHGRIKMHREISSITGAEEVVRAHLGGVDKVSDPQSDGCDDDEAEEAVGGLVVSGSQSSAEL